MGIQWLGITTTITMLKSIFFVAALVAAVHAEAEADADADAYYSTLGYHGLGYTNYGFNGFRSYAAPAVGYTRSYGYAGPYTHGAYRHFGKRSADAEPEAEADADADAYYSTLGYNGLGYANYGYNGYRSYVAPAYTRSFGYASPYAYNYGAYRHFGKRSADAEADADAYYSTLGYHGLGYSNYGFNGYRSYVAPAYNYGSYSYASPYAYGRYHY